MGHFPLLISLSSGSTPDVGFQALSSSIKLAASHQKHVWHHGQGVTFPQGIRGARSPLPWQKMLPQEQLQPWVPCAELTTARSTAVPGWLVPSVPCYSQRIKGWMLSSSTMQQVWILSYHTKLSQESCPGFVYVEWAMCRVLTAQGMVSGSGRPREEVCQVSGFIHLPVEPQQAPDMPEAGVNVWEVWRSSCLSGRAVCIQPSSVPRRGEGGQGCAMSQLCVPSLQTSTWPGSPNPTDPKG